MIGLAASKLNEVIAALFGVLFIAHNVLGFMRMLSVDTGLQPLNQLADTLFNLLPISWADIQQKLDAVFMVSIQVPFKAASSSALWQTLSWPSHSVRPK